MAKDKFHDLVASALVAEGWKVTHDPYFLYFGEKKVAADLGLEKWIIAEKADQKIVVEVKSFISGSLIHELHHTVGQLDFYHLLLKKQEPDRMLFLAMPNYAYYELVLEPVVQEFLTLHQVKIILYNTDNESIESWIN